MLTRRLAIANPMTRKFSGLLLKIVPLWLLGLQGIASAQDFSPLDTSAVAPTSILPATSDTTVVQQSNQFTILGGQSSSGTTPNIVHQFHQFNVGTADTANFVVTPDVANVISLINDLQPSEIDGLLRLISSEPNVDSNANLFLVNPAGIVFGENATFNIPANLTATTASGLLFEDMYHLSIDGSVSEIALPASGSTVKGGTSVATVDNLTGDPNGYVFSAASASSTALDPLSQELPTGSIHNRGTLQVSPQASITFVGQYIQNDGDLATHGGTITLVAVPGENLLRLSQTGSLLSLDLIPTASLAAFSAIDLPQRLTGGDDPGANQIRSNSDGSQVITNTLPLTPAPGKVLVRGTIDVSDSSGQGVVNITGEHVNLIGGDIHADGVSQAGTISIGEVSVDDGMDTETVWVDRNSTLSTNAPTGTGGVIRVRATDTVRFYGEATAEGANPTLDGTVILDAGENLDIRKPVAR